MWNLMSIKWCFWTQKIFDRFVRQKNWTINIMNRIECWNSSKGFRTNFNYSSLWTKFMMFFMFRCWNSVKTKIRLRRLFSWMKKKMKNRKHSEHAKTRKQKKIFNQIIWIFLFEQSVIIWKKINKCSENFQIIFKKSFEKWIQPTQTLKWLIFFANWCIFFNFFFTKKFFWF